VLGNIEEGLQRQTEYFAKVVNRSECNLLAKNAAYNDGGSGGRSRSEPKLKDKQRGARGGSGKHGAGSERHSSPPRGDRRDSNQRESRGRPSASNGGYASDDSRLARPRPPPAPRVAARPSRRARQDWARRRRRSRQQRPPQRAARDAPSRRGVGRQRLRLSRRRPLGGAPVARVWMSSVTKPSRPPGGSPRWSAASCLAHAAGPRAGIYPFSGPPFHSSGVQPLAPGARGAAITPASEAGVVEHSATSPSHCPSSCCSSGSC